MASLGRLGGLLADLALGLPTAATPYTVERDIPVPMPDAVTLVGDRYHPTEDPGPLPVVLIRTPYGRAGFGGQVFAAPLARRGFQVFLQATRGTFGSGGHFRPFTTEREDGLATVGWLREQPWCDGRVAMTGSSYFGHTQWAVAPYADPPLVSMSPHVAAARASLVFYDHGAPQIQNALTWSALIGSQERGGDLLRVVANPVFRARVQRALRRMPLQAADVAVTGVPVPFWRDFVAHAEPGDPFWSAADHDSADLSRCPPVSMVTGWWDLFLRGQLADHRALRAAGVPARIVVGPWLHGEIPEIRAVLRDDVAWLDHHLRGGPAPSGAPVRVYLQHARRWLDLPEWPPPQSRPLPYHLHPDAHLSPDPPPPSAAPTPSTGGPTPAAPADPTAATTEHPAANDRAPATAEPTAADPTADATVEVGGVEAGGAETGSGEVGGGAVAGSAVIYRGPVGDEGGPSRFTYDPADPTPSVGGPLLQPPGKQTDNRLVEARPDVLIFTSPPLPADLDVVGPVRARLYVRPELEHADVFVRLCEVNPGGVSRNVVDGIRRLDPRTVPAPDVAVGADGVLAVDIELYPTAYRVKAGHRLRVQVAGGAFPRYARNLGTAEPFGTATAGRPCRFEVFHDPDHPSHITLPVLT
jgi:putative CocE/NonD family hydrolase